MSKVEDKVADYYGKIWDRFVLWWKAEETLGLHFALYDDGIKNFKDAILNNNDYVGRLLEIDENASMNILDAGCGVGGTTIYLAEKYSNSHFNGITITPEQLELANKFSREIGLVNTTFMLKNYLDTGFPENNFDGVFALESSSYAANKQQLANELFRILKPEGKVVIIDTFFKGFPKNPIMKKIHDLACIGRGMPIQQDDILINEFIGKLQNAGFKDITVSNLTKKVRKSGVRAFTIGVPYFLFSILKYLIKRGRYDISKDPDFYVGASVLCNVYGLAGEGGYYSIVASK